MAIGDSRPAISPNPARNRLTVSVGPERANVELRDAAGRVVARGSGSGTVRIDIARLPAGWYSVAVLSRGGAAARPLVIVR